MAKKVSEKAPDQGSKLKLNEIVEKFNKINKDAEIILIDGDFDRNIPVNSFGSLAVDIASGVGGLPQGRIIELYGPESSGKTTLTLHILAEVQKHGGIAAFIDAEHCLKEGTLVFNVDKGSYDKVENLVGAEFTVLSYDKNNQPFYQKAICKLEGPRDVYEIKCKYGKVIYLTGNHKVLTKCGYKRVDELSVEDVMYSPYNIGNLPEAPAKYNHGDKLELFRLLGLHMGDGSINASNIATNDPAIAEDIGYISSLLDCKVKKTGSVNYRISQKSKKTKYVFNAEAVKDLFDSGFTLGEICDYYGVTYDTMKRHINNLGVSPDNYRTLASPVRNKKRGKIVAISNTDPSQSIKNDVHIFLNQFDCFSRYSKDRFFPSFLSRDQIAQVISGLLMSDGTVVDPEKNKRSSLSFSTGSYHLARDLEMALLRFGIFSTLSSTTKLGYTPTYKVTVSGIDNIRKFNDNIYTYSYKGERITRALKLIKPLNRISVNNGLAECKVLSVKKCEGVYNTYDISVKSSDFSSQNFVAEGLVIHNSLDIKYAENLGIKVEELLISQPSCGEEALDAVETLAGLLGSGDVIVVDSVAALTPRAEIEGDMGDSHMGLQARLMSQACRKLVSLASKSGVAIVFINQIRQKIGVTYGSNEVTAGGNALKFYASQRVEVRKIGSVKVGDEIVANTVRVKFIKNKVAPPFKEAESQIRFGRGFNKGWEILTLASNAGIIDKSGSWYSYSGTQIGQGENKVLDFFDQNPEIAQEIESKVREYYKI